MHSNDNHDAYDCAERIREYLGKIERGKAIPKRSN
mgnify:CR=1 FL=1|jgi:hypothetical protein